MVEDPTLIVPNVGPARPARWRRVLGLGLLVVGLGDLLFMNIVLLPQVLAGPTPPSPVAVAPEPGVPRIEPEASPQVPPSSTTPFVNPAPPGGPAAPEAPPAAPSPPSPAASSPQEPPAFAPLLFESGLARLSPLAQEALAKLITLLRSDPGRRVRLEGHTDSSGPERFNLTLSRLRAENVRSWLINLGIDQTRIDINAHGSEQPAYAGNTPKARAKNRRVEIFLN